MPRFNSLEEMVLATAEAVRPPERLTVPQAAVKYRKLNNPGSYVGPWDNDIAPYLVEIQDEFTSLEHTAVIFAGPARCGKSDIFFNYLTHTAICDPADMLLVHMTQATARDWSQGDLAKVFRTTTDLGERLVPGRQNDNVHDKRFQSGMRLLIKWPTITELSGKTVPRQWLMDYDRMSQDVDGEGNPFDLTRKRGQTFGRFAMCVAESSPGFVAENPKWVRSTPHEAPPTQGILALYNRGDRRRWYWRCVSCGNAFEPHFSLITYPDSGDHMEAAEAAVMNCPHCGQVYHHDGKDGVPGKHEINRTRARWVKDGVLWKPDGGLAGTPRRSDIASFWLSGAAAAFTSWKDIVLKYLKALEEYENTGSENALKSTVNVDQGDVYVPKAMQSDRVPEELKARAKEVGQRVVPRGVRFLVATVDVQKARFCVQVTGVGVGGDFWIVDRFDIRKSKRRDEDGDPVYIEPGAYPEDWQLLVDEVMYKTYPLSDGSGRHMQIKLTLCDSAGREGVTANAYNFYRWLRDDHPGGLAKRFLLLKGTPNQSAPRVVISYPDSERKDRHANARGEIPVLFINSNSIKDMADNMLGRRDPFGGLVTFPKWLPDSFYSELCVEIKTAKGWENLKNLRNESWDLLCYAIAATLCRFIKIEQLDWESPPGWAAEWDANDLVFSPETDEKPFEPKQKDDYDLAKLAASLA